MKRKMKPSPNEETSWKQNILKYKKLLLNQKYFFLILTTENTEFFQGFNCNKNQQKWRKNDKLRQI